jgi:hypothetical protein
VFPGQAEPRVMLLLYSWGRGDGERKLETYLGLRKLLKKQRMEFVILKVSIRN